MTAEIVSLQKYREQKESSQNKPPRPEEPARPEIPKASPSDITPDGDNDAHDGETA